MDITLAGGAAFPHFDRLVVLGQWIIILGFIAQLTVGVSRLFRGAAPEILPALVKTALAWWAITSLPMIGSGAFKYGALLAEAIAGEEQMRGFLQAIEGILMAIYQDGVDIADVFSVEFWLGLASTVCIAFAYISKYIVLEILWPLYLGLVVISGTFSISLATLPGLRTAQSWILTLLEAVSWPMIFQILLGVVAAVTEQQVVTMERISAGEIDFVPMLEGLATLCAVSFLTVMTPILAARLMRGEGASAAMSFVAAKAATMVSGLTARAAIAAVATPARAGANAIAGGRAPLPRRPSGPEAPGGGGGSLPPSPSDPKGKVGAVVAGAAALGGHAGGAASTAASASAARPDRRSVAGKSSDAHQRSGSAARGSAPQATQPHSAGRESAAPGQRTGQQTGSNAQGAISGAAGSTQAGAASSTRPATHAPSASARTSLPEQPARPEAAHDEPRTPSARTLPRSSSSSVSSAARGSNPSSSRGVGEATAQAHVGSGRSLADPHETPDSPRRTAYESRSMTPSDSGQARAATPLNAAKAKTHARSAGAPRTQANPQRAEKTKPRASSKTDRAPASPPGSTPLDWNAPRRAAAQQTETASTAAPRGRFYNIKGSTKEATAGIIAAKKAGNLRRAQQIRDIVKAHPLTDTSSAAKATRRGLIRKAIQRLDQPDTPKGPGDA